MKNRIQLLIVICLCIVFLGCNDKSEDKPVNPVSNSCLLANFTTATYKIAFQYDNQERVLKQSFTTLSDSVIDFQAYDYSTAGKVFINKNSNLYKCEITLNARGDAQTKKETYYLSLNPLEIDIINETEYTYDNAGYLTMEKLSTTDGGNVYINSYEYIWLDGNLVTQKNINSKGATETTFNYTYYTDMLNALDKTERKVNLNGLKSKNLAKTREEVRTGSAPILNSYAYTKDSKGNLATMTVSVSGSPDNVSKVNWTCN